MNTLTFLRFRCPQRISVTLFTFITLHLTTTFLLSRKKENEGLCNTPRKLTDSCKNRFWQKTKERSFSAQNSLWKRSQSVALITLPAVPAICYHPRCHLRCLKSLRNWSCKEKLQRMAQCCLGVTHSSAPSMTLNSWRQTLSRSVWY